MTQENIKTKKALYKQGENENQNNKYCWKKSDYQIMDIIKAIKIK